MISTASLEHLVAHADRRPALADDVLVEVLAGAEPEPEAVAGQDLHGRRLLRDDRRVVAQRRAGHVGHQPIRSVACAAAPRIDQAYGEWPCSSSQGW